jgi:hypothetical protein
MWMLIKTTKRHHHAESVRDLPILATAPGTVGLVIDLHNTPVREPRDEVPSTLLHFSPGNCTLS